MKSKWTMLVWLVGIVFMSNGAFGAAVNDASLINENWDDMKVRAGGKGEDIGWMGSPGTGGNVSANDGKLTINMTDARDGAATISSLRLDEFAASGLFPSKYIVTTRAEVQQFPDVNISPNTWPAKGITLVDARREQRLMVVLTPSSLWINSGKNWTEIPVKTAAGVYYTWQFEVDDTLGTVAVFRSEEGGELNVLATDVMIRSQDVPDQIVAGAVSYNGENSKLQGILVIDDFQIGKETR
jgi:hypothetical protein